MQNALALLRQASRLWVIVLRTTLIMLATMMMGALLAFQFYRQSIAIIGQSASAQTVIGLQEPLRVVFSQPMDEATVAASLSISPATAVELTWNARSTELSIVPRTTWIADSPYVISLDRPARSATFLPIEPWRMQFNTRAVLRVAQFLPAHLSTDVATESLVVVRFTQQMVPQTAVQIPLAEPLLQITPIISTTQEWLDTQTLALSSTVYAQNQKYTVTVPASLRDSNGRTLDNPVTHAFTTRAHSLNAITPPDGAIAVGSNEELVVTLSGTLDVAAVRSAVQIRPPTDVTFAVQVGAEGTSLLTIRPVTGWLYDRDYTVTFAGIGSQQISTVTHFHTAPALMLVAQSPANGQPLQAHRDLRLVFNAPLDSDTAAAAIHFSPEPIRPARIEVHGNDIRIQGVWATQTAPVLRVDTTLRSLAGNSLPADIIQTFVIDPRATQLSLPGEPTDIVDSTLSGTIRINVAPHTTAALTLTALSPASLARVRALSPADFADYDPARYGILPFASVPITTELEPSFEIDIQSLVPDSISTRVVFARVNDSKGAYDTRFIRILPATLYALTVGNALVVGTPLEADETPHRFEVYQDGVAKIYGTANAEGIWNTTALTPDVPAIIIDTTTPFDFVERVITQRTAVPLQLDLLSAKERLHAGDVIAVACARSQAEVTMSATIAMTRLTGQVVTSRAVLWSTGLRIAHTTLRIPIDTQPGIAILSCATETERHTKSVLIMPSEQMAVTIERTNTADGMMSQVSVNDIAQRPVAGAEIYWQEGAAFSSTQTDSNGSANVPDTLSDDELIIMTKHVRAIVQSLPDSSFRIEPVAQWYGAGIPFTLAAQLSAREPTPNVPAIEVTVRDTTDNIQLIRTLSPDAQGVVTTSLTLPSGQWFVIMRAGRLTARTTLNVAEMPDGTRILAQYPSLPRDQAIEFLTRAPQNERILVASMRDDGLQSTWAEGSDNGILTTTGVTNTTTIDYGYATRGAATHTGVLQISDAACTSASLTAQRESAISIRITLSAPAESFVALAVTNPDTGETSWRTDLTIPADGILSVPFSDTGTAAIRDIRAIVAHPYCQRIISQHTLLRNAPFAYLDAPNTLAIGDVFPLRYAITGLTPGETITVQLDTQALLITDPLPMYTGIADEAGTVTFSWHMRLLRADPSVEITSKPDLQTVWKPTVLAPLMSTSTDGFFLTGRTTLEAGRLDTPYDVLRSAVDVATALDEDDLRAPTVAHLAHLIWLRNERHDTSTLMRALSQAQHKDGGWGNEDGPPVDTLLTTDVVTALSYVAGQQSRIVPLIPQLRNVANNPILPLTERALAVYALSLQGIRDDDAMHSLSALRDTLGNEGLAAILLSAPLYPDIDARPILTTMANRALPATRGVQWAVDPATAGLHSLAAQNMLVGAALAQAQADPALLAECRSFLLRLRGVGGWGDAIANARAWHMRNVLFPELTNTQRLSITDSSGHLVSTSAIVHAQRIRSNISIWSDSPVLIGIEYPRDPMPPTQAAIVRQQVFTDEGTALAHLSRLSLGQSVTVVSDVVLLAALPYARISLPVPALTELTIQTLPSDFLVQKSPTGYIFALREPHAGVWRIRYRLTAVRSGSSTVQGMQISDAAGSLHAFQTMSTLYVSTP